MAEVFGTGDFRGLEADGRKRRSSGETTRGVLGNERVSGPTVLGEGSGGGLALQSLVEARAESDPTLLGGDSGGGLALHCWVEARAGVWPYTAGWRLGRQNSGKFPHLHAGYVGPFLLLPSL